ncbi:AMINO-ACID PERMEASE BAT1 [Salix viminalis]|uniref:AMINO-ACID PERMEASE BAT1 n=1 Tax=Salix viminalis TaxID=40686 RepID=A0A9Q0UIK7_SALVM|nr:AMINO-ACID PERMEASE BAT1 [Salix viminalis]
MGTGVEYGSMDQTAFKIDSAEKRLNELGYKQELRREMTFFKTLAITFSSMAVFTGTPLYGSSLRYAGPASLIWGWVVVTFFTWFVGFAMAEICSSFPVYIISHRLPLPLFIHHGIRPLNCPSINKICQ